VRFVVNRPPGKTTIASMLASGCRKCGSFMLKLDDPGIVAAAGPGRPRSSFGWTTRFVFSNTRIFLSTDWNHVLPQIKTMLRKGAKIVMTHAITLHSGA